MSVKGATQHRLIRVGMRVLLEMTTLTLSAPEREACQTLIRRADLALDRIKTRKLRRADAQVAPTEGP